MCGLLGACSPGGAAPGSVPARGGAATARQDPAELPEFIPDPLEPANRGVWAVNRGLLVGVIQPTSRAYRAVVAPVARRSIRDFTRNITYPGRCLNHLLQGRWAGAANESLRFICNTTVGVGGLFDMAGRWHLPRSEADFAQTFTRWGWTSRTYLMLPILGPSDDCHAVGWAADEAAEPWSYATPYRYADYGTYYNELTDEADEYVRLMRSEADPYAAAKYSWTYSSRFTPPDWRTTVTKDTPTLQTLAVAKIACHDPDFPQHGQQLSVRLPSTGRNLTFNCWLHTGSAPLVYVAPGLGSHRLSMTTLALAENLYLHGFSVVTTTSVFHPEFIEQASTSALPAYPPADCQDLLVSLTAIDGMLQKKHPGMLGKRALVGFSLGGFEALHLAAREKRAAPGLLRFDRYVAINSPVRLDYGIACIDGFSDAVLAWPPAERQFRANNAIHKATDLQNRPVDSTADLPLDGIESKFLIGLTFRMILRDAIFSSQSQHDLGVLRVPLSRWRREPCYQEISNYSYHNYFLKFVAPYYHQRGVKARDFMREANLMTYQSALQSQSKVRVLLNRNDFLTTSADISWMRSTFGPARLKVFPDGGHLGNMASGPVQAAIVESLRGLQ